MSLLCICDFLFMVLYDGLCECAWKVTMKHEKLVTTIWPAILGAVSHFFYSSRFLLILHWAVLSWLPFNSQVHHWVLYMTGSVLHNTWFHQDIASVYIQETSNKSPKNGGTRVLEPEWVEKWLLLSVCCAMVDTRERSLSRETKHPDGWERSGVRLLSTLHYRLSSEN